MAGNPSTPAATLVMLADDSEDWFDEYVANNFNGYSDYTKRDVVSSDYAASFVLAENSNSIFWLKRYAIAQNQNTLRDTLEVLVRDSNRIVRATAKESLKKIK